ncbi:MAG: hypothetical protein SFU27_03715, partial [Thermonemataceae bacterium]|nr:hypothetical protein [Thermonemataceae bacterium]
NKIYFQKYKNVKKVKLNTNNNQIEQDFNINAMGVLQNNLALIFRNNKERILAIFDEKGIEIFSYKLPDVFNGACISDNKSYLLIIRENDLQIIINKF